MRHRMKEIISGTLLFIVATFALGQSAIEPTNEFGLSHQEYINDEVKIVPFDREEYERIKKLMILKSKGLVVADMDNIDPDFDPERYVENNPNEESYWQRSYDAEDGEFVDDWDRYYEGEYGNYERFRKQDYKEVQRLEREQRSVRGGVRFPGEEPGACAGRPGGGQRGPAARGGRRRRSSGRRAAPRPRRRRARARAV